MVFTKFMKVVATFVRAPRFANGTYFRSAFVPQRYVRRGTRMLVYLDNLLFLLPSNRFTQSAA